MALWQQIILLTSITLSILGSRTAPHLLLGGSIWKTIPLLIILQAIPYLIYSILLYPIYLTPLRKFPQAPNSHPLLGQFRRITREPTGEPMKDWMENVPNEGIIYYRTFLNAGRVLITSPKALQEVLQTKSYDFVKPWQIREGLGRLLGVGILLAEGDEHKRQRKNLNPAFAFRHVKELYPVFWGKGVEMVAAMNAAISGDQTSGQPNGHSGTGDAEKPKASNVLEVNGWASRTTLDIIGVAGMGQDFNAIAKPDNELYTTYQNIFTPNRTARILGILSLIIPTWFLRALPLRRNDDINAASSTVKRVARDLIQTKKAKLEKGQSSDVDILSVALESGGFSDEDLVNQLMTFLAAGHETTASSMNWAVLQLCRHPEMQERLRRELKEAGVTSPLSANPPSEVSAADLERVPYLHAFCNEVLRLNPPVAMTLRQARCDTSIIGQFIPKGTTVILAPLAVNQDKALWGSDAQEFNPERWMQPGQAGSGGAKSAYAFMT